MFENNNSDDATKNGVNNNNNGAFLQRNVSSSGMSENEILSSSLRFDVSIQPFRICIKPLNTLFSYSERR